MGWFLSSKKSKKGRGSNARGKKLTKKKASPLAGKGWDPSTTLANMWLISWMLLLVGGSVAWYFGESYLMNYVSKQHRDAVVTVELVDTPAWMDERLVDHLRREIELMIDADPFDRDALKHAAEQLTHKPWIEHVQRVVRTGTGAIEVHAVYRRPTALIQAEDGFHLVDRHGVRLPARYSSDQAEATGLLVIKGVRQPPPLEGRLWLGDDVQAGLKLARLVRQADWSEDVVAVDVHNFAGRLSESSPHIVLPTQYGGILRWGRALGQEQFYEPAAEIKLRHVERVRRQSPSGTICAGGRIVDVWSDTVYIHQARADEDNSSANLRYTLTSD
ncbi:MAG: hypothetical protein WD294_05570 [Phycisphaeraceae bacterium]